MGSYYVVANVTLLHSCSFALQIEAKKQVASTGMLRGDVGLRLGIDSEMGVIKGQQPRLALGLTPNFMYNTTYMKKDSK